MQRKKQGLWTTATDFINQPKRQSDRFLFDGDPFCQITANPLVIKPNPLFAIVQGLRDGTPSLNHITDPIVEVSADDVLQSQPAQLLQAD